jgi:molybdate transport system substrate-binding protein
MLLPLMFLVPFLGMPQERVPPITVSAAISLTDVLEEIAAAYAAQGGGPVRLNLAASNVLARQIVNGAPADLFISADEAQMDLVEAAEAMAPASRVALVGNRLAVVAAADRLEIVRSKFAEAPAAIRRLAIGDPAAVPSGKYARAYLEMCGLWVAYEARIVPTSNVRAALAAVENGAADAAIVYATDVQASRGAALAFVVPPDQAPRITYSAAIVGRSSRRVEGGRFLRFLQGKEAGAIFARHGFLAARR